MNRADERRPNPDDIGRYCREVEAHLTRANGGHLVRVVGPAFALVRSWATDGVPLSVVFRAIDDKAERHRAGASTYALRIEFCEADVRDAFRRWRRAVGVASVSDGEAAPDGPTESPGFAGTGGDTVGRRPSLAKHLERVIDRLTRLAGRMELPDALRALAGEHLEALTAIQVDARGARGANRDALVARLGPLDRALIEAARAAMSSAELEILRREAEAELDQYRRRIAPDAWERAIEVTVDRLLRERLGLPVMTLEDARA